VDDWLEHQLDLLEEKTSTTNPQRYVETDERLWTNFETAFQDAFQDTTRAQDAYTALMQLEMKGKDIDTDIATFDRLVARAGWSTSDKGVMEKFQNGLA
jgi:arginine utilization protein RocB